VVPFWFDDLVFSDHTLAQDEAVGSRANRMLLLRFIDRSDERCTNWSEKSLAFRSSQVVGLKVVVSPEAYNAHPPLI
jgi:hypothetical protein